MFAEGEKVFIIKCKRGYTGPAEIVCRVFGLMYLVKIDDAKIKTALVRATDMRNAR